MKIVIKIAVICSIILLITAVAPAEVKKTEPAKTIEEIYPNLASGVLTFARIGEITKGVLLKAENVEIRYEDINKHIEAQPAQLREQLKKNAFFVLEQEATNKLLLQVAKKTAKNPNGKDAKKLVDNYTKQLTEKATVTEQEIQKFYIENESIFCGTPFEKVKDQIGPYVLQKKKQSLVTEYIRTLGQRVDITVSATWVKQQAALAKDNPLDKVRSNGKPTLAVFSAASCCGPDKMLPVLDSLKSQYAKAVNITYLEARKEQILASRHNVNSIPTQIFFDKAGKEVFRHTGFFSKDQISNKLVEIGVK
jgi:thioredoxin